MLIDTHAHLWFDDYANDLDNVIARAIKAGVEKMIVPGTDIESSKKAIELARKYPGVIFAAVGVHPEELVVTNKYFEETPPTFGVPTRDSLGSPVEESPLGLRDLLSGRVLRGQKSPLELLPLRSDLEIAVAIGEIGTDKSTEELRACMGEQKELFKVQCEMAIKHDLPVIIHTRDSFEETWEVLTSLPKMPRGQFHCFSVDETALKMVVQHEFYVSFCGNITWSKRVARLVSLVPDDRLLLETDSPFMIPRVNDRERQWATESAESSEHSPIIAQGSELGDRNEPANVRILAEKIADLRGQTVEQIAEITTKNANALFRL